MNSYLANFINLLLSAYWILLFAHFILSWIPKGLPRTREFVYSLTEPVLMPIRKVLPSMGGLDLSILVALLLINLLQTLIARLI